jgi:hypothetical protein
VSRAPEQIAHAILQQAGRVDDADREMPSDEDLAVLARAYLAQIDPATVDRARLFVSLAAAKEFAAATGRGPEGLEAARRELAEHLLRAKRSTEDPTSWRVRPHPDGGSPLALSLRVGPDPEHPELLVVTRVGVRDFRPQRGGRRG